VRHDARHTASLARRHAPRTRTRPEHCRGRRCLGALARPARSAHCGTVPNPGLPPCVVAVSSWPIPPNLSSRGSLPLRMAGLFKWRRRESKPHGRIWFLLGSTAARPLFPLKTGVAFRPGESRTVHWIWFFFGPCRASNPGAAPPLAVVPDLRAVVASIQALRYAGPGWPPSPRATVVLALALCAAAARLYAKHHLGPWRLPGAW